MAKAKAKLTIVQSAAPQVTCALEYITPDLAKEWLELLDENRKYSGASGEAYARDMETGDWVVTNASIGFREDGKLIDGQHRLRACVLSGRPFWCIVVRGLSAEAQDYIDCGRMRSFADRLAFGGLKEAWRVAAAARVIWGIKLGVSKLKGRSSPAELTNIVRRHPGLAASCTGPVNLMTLRPAILSALHYIGHDILGECEAAETFMAAFHRVEPAYKGCAASAFKEMLGQERMRHVRMERHKMLRIAIHVWNLHANRLPLNWKTIPDNPTIEGLDLARL